MRSILLALALALIATPAAAQHCWPSTIALLVRDARGGTIDPERLDSIAYTPTADPDTADFRVRREHINIADSHDFDGTTPVLAWRGHGDCRVDVREVVLRRGGEVMRLWMDLHVHTLRKHGPSQFLLATPPFGAGTWRLDVCAMPEGDQPAFTVLPERWTRVSASGDPGTPPQMPQNCGSAATP
ncbi:MAG TPA: hypothetical protein VFS20_01625 [Longimicrobium sp.]|nr:hypothetical protein [Longimicrobium sp.]